MGLIYDHEPDTKQKQKKHVEISSTKDDGETFKRRQTGVRYKLLQKLQDLAADDSFLALNTVDRKRNVSITVPRAQQRHNKIQRRPTGFVRVIGENDDKADVDDNGDDDSDDEKKTILKSYETETDERRTSLLCRLYDEIENREQTYENGPTLKEYKPFSEFNVPKNILLTKNSDSHMIKSDEETPKDKFLLRSPTKYESYERVLSLQHGKKLARKVSSDYFKTIDQIQKKTEASIRGMEYAKTRPTLSVSEYQKRNIELKEQRQLESHTALKSLTSTKGKVSGEFQLRSFLSKNMIKTPAHGKIASNKRGLRMPGDSPLYLSELKLEKLE